MNEQQISVEDFIIAAVRKLRRKPTLQMERRGSKPKADFEEVLRVATAVFSSTEVTKAANTLILCGALLVTGQETKVCVRQDGSIERLEWRGFEQYQIRAVTIPHEITLHDKEWGERRDRGWLVGEDGPLSSTDMVSPGEYVFVSGFRAYVVADGLPRGFSVKNRSFDLAQEILKELKR